jgi:hypothetical protein
MHHAVSSLYCQWQFPRLSLYMWLYIKRTNFVKPFTQLNFKIKPNIREGEEHMLYYRLVKSTMIWTIMLDPLNS